jgi:hypothetical protein
MNKGCGCYVGKVEKKRTRKIKFKNALKGPVETRNGLAFHSFFIKHFLLLLLETASSSLLVFWKGTIPSVEVMEVVLCWIHVDEVRHAKALDRTEFCC